MIVAIIDDGLDTRYVGKLAFDLVAELHGEKAVLHERKECNPGFTHGTFCAVILALYAKEACFGCLKVINETTGRADARLVAAAIDWCTDNGIRLIEMSIGAAQPGAWERVRFAAARFARAGGVLVAAANNQEVFSVPACLPSAIGVVCDKELEGDAVALLPPAAFSPYLRASGIHRNIKIQLDFRYYPSNSYAAPAAAAHAYRLLEQGEAATLFQVKKRFEKDSTQGRSPLYKPDFVDTLTLLGKPNGEEGNYAYPVTQILDPECASLCTREWLLLYPGELEQKLEFLRREQKKVAGVVYAGEAENALSSLCSTLSVPLFDERCTTSIPETVAGASLPLILFSGERRERLVRMRQVQQCFWQADYAALAVSACERAYLYGINYNQDCPDRLALAIAALLPVDVLLLDEEAAAELPMQRLLCGPGDDPEELVRRAVSFFD